MPSQTSRRVNTVAFTLATVACISSAVTDTTCAPHPYGDSFHPHGPGIRSSQWAFEQEYRRHGDIAAAGHKFYSEGPEDLIIGLEDDDTHRKRVQRLPTPELLLDDLVDPKTLATSPHSEHAHSSTPSAEEPSISPGSEESATTAKQLYCIKGVPSDATPGFPALVAHGHKVFSGQTFKDASPRSQIAFLRAVFGWTYSVDFHIEAQTSKDDKHHGTGCSWIYTRTAEQQQQLLSLHKKFLVDITSDGSDCLVTSGAVLEEFPHLWTYASHIAEADVCDGSLDEFARSRIGTRQRWDRISRGPMTFELPRGESRPRAPRGAHRFRGALPAAVAAMVATTYRYNPYGTVDVRHYCA